MKANYREMAKELSEIMHEQVGAEMNLCIPLFKMQLKCVGKACIMLYFRELCSFSFYFSQSASIAIFLHSTVCQWDEVLFMCFSVFYYFLIFSSQILCSEQLCAIDSGEAQECSMYTGFVFILLFFCYTMTEKSLPQKQVYCSH